MSRPQVYVVGGVAWYYCAACTIATTVQSDGSILSRWADLGTDGVLRFVDAGR